MDNQIDNKINTQDANPSQKLFWSPRLLVVGLGTIFSIIVLLVTGYIIELVLIDKTPSNSSDKISIADFPQAEKTAFGTFPKIPPLADKPIPEKPVPFWPDRLHTEIIPADTYQPIGIGAFKLATKSYRSIRKISATNEAVWDVFYELDEEYLRRKTPLENIKKPKDVDRGFIMLGDSRVFGEGLNDNETLAAQLGQKIKNVRFYNYAIPGLFPGEALDRIRLIKAAGPGQEIQENKNTLIYFYSPYHIYRSVGALNQIAFWGYKKPYYYKNENGEIVQKETIKSAMPIRSWFADIFSAKKITQYYRLNWPRITEQDWEFFIDLMKQIKQNGDRLKVDKFYVIIYPGYDPTASDFIRHLEKAGIPYISYAHWRIDQLTNGITAIPNEGHPTAEYNRILAQALSEQEFLFK